MTATPMHAFAIGAAPAGALRPFAPAVLARTVAVLEDRAPAPPALIVRPPRTTQVVRPC
jgi:hypothetical protein